jgi:chromosome segregation ATPase
MLLTACVQNSKEYRQLKAESDSLRLDNARSNMQIEEMMSILNEIEADFQSIRSAENYLNVQSQTDGELAPTAREQIHNNMQIINETLHRNKEQIARLEALLKQSNTQSDAFRKTIERLAAELEEKTRMIVTLQEDLEKKNVHIEELSREIASLKEDVDQLAYVSESQSKKIEAQDTELNTAYYCFGTSRELKDQKILSGGGIFSKSKVLEGDFNRSYFIPIDLRQTTEIELYSRKAALKSNHPDGSYEYGKDKDGNLIFRITDAKAFWSLGKYLVIQVD